MKNIDGVGFTNFRIFKESSFLDFEPLTILTGTNNSGKSTVLTGLHLIQSNYSNIQFSRDKNDFDLNKLFLKDFAPDSIIKQYGSLGKMISFDSDTNEFSFCLQKKMKMINDIAVIKFTVAVQDNKMKSGRLVRLSIRSKNTDKDIFTIEETNGNPKEHPSSLAYYSHHTTTIDLHYYYCEFYKWMQKAKNYFDGLAAAKKLTIDLNNGLIDRNTVERKIKEINSEYGSGLDINREGNHYELIFLYEHPYVNLGPERCKAIVQELENGLFYNFSFLWEDRPNDELYFIRLVEKIYGKYSPESLHKLTLDIFHGLTAHKWTSPEYIIPLDQDNPEIHNFLGLNYIHFHYGFSLSLRGVGIFDDTNYSEISLTASINKKPGEYAFLSSDLVEKINNPEELISLLATMIAERNKEFNAEVMSIHDFFTDTNLREKALSGRYKLPVFTASESEKNFHDTFIFENLNIINECFQPFRHIEFISTDRANSRRVQSILEQDDLSRYARRHFEMESKFSTKAEQFMSEWIKNFGIADKVEFKKDEDSENFKIFVVRKSREILLADIGYGAAQLLPLLLACFPVIEKGFNLQRQYTPKTIVIEEPESNLHPALQSKLADFFVAASKQFHIQFIIETHSEYLIRKLQYLTAKGQISADDTVIYYIYPPEQISQGEDQVKKINIQEDGSLTDDFGTGFFDEADKIAMSIWNMNKAQKN